jgi:hypothetical protein
MHKLPLHSTSETCWSCGLPASADCAVTLILVAPSWRKLDPLGHTVRRSFLQHEIRVPVPRCRACRNRNRRGEWMIGAAAIGGGLMLPLLHWVYSPLFPPGIRVNHYALFSLAALAGSLGGLYLGLLARFLRRKGLGLRSLTSYPAIEDLRKQGWNFPSSD